MNLTKLIKEEHNNIINEVGNASAKSYDYEVIGTYEDESIEYSFVTDLNTKYEVGITEFYTQDFSKRGNTGISLDFIANDSIKIENKGELYKVMATITNIIKNYIKNKKIDIIHFQTDNKRHKLYAAYLKKYFSKKIEVENNNVYYFLKKNIIKEEDYRGEHEAPSREYGSPLYDVRQMFGNDFYILSTKEIVRQFGANNPYDTQLASLILSYKDKPNKPIKIYRAIPDFDKKNKDKIKDLYFIVRYYDKFNFYPPTYKYKKYNGIVEEYENIIKNENNNIGYDELQKEIYKRIYQDINNLADNKKKYTINPGDWVTIIRDYAVQHGKNELNNYIILYKTVKASEIYTEGYMEEWGYDPGSKLNEDYSNQTEDDIQALVDIIDIDPNSPKMDMYKDTLKNKYNYEYIKPELRYKKDIEIVNNIINKKYKTTTSKGLQFYFITKPLKDLPRTVLIKIYNNDNDIIGEVGFNINTFEKSIKIGGVNIIEEYRRKGIYNRIVDYIESIANKNNLEIKEGSRSSDARAFWNNRNKK